MNIKNVIKCGILGTVMSLAFFSPFHVKASELETDILISTGGDGKRLHDEMYSTYTVLDEGDFVEVSAKEGIKGIYIVWNKPVKEWTLNSSSGEMTCGKDGFLHEYVELDGTSKSIRITSNSNGMQLSEVYVCGEGKLPDNFQVWEKPAEKADILIFSAHADDEILFFGGVMPTYIEQGARIEVVYMTQFWDTTEIREHEKLDGLYVCGVRNYPVNPTFTDYYCETLADAEAQYNDKKVIEYMVENLRRFQPSVVVTHDFDGEYGHGYHKYVADRLVKALDAAKVATEYADSSSKYGTWDVPKTYIHLYNKNVLTLDLRKPLKTFDDKTALEVAKAAYKMHWSQQWTWYFVDDGLDEKGNPNDYKYSCAKFGLYRTNVGADTTGSMLDNVKLVKEIEAEKAAKEAEEASKKAALESKAAADESKRAKESERALAAEDDARKKADNDVRTMISICIAIIILIVSALLLVHLTTSRRFRKYVRRRKK